MNETVRVLTVDDARRLAELVSANREFLAPWEPRRSPQYFTEGYQRREIIEALAQYRDGLQVPLAMIDNGQVVGRINLNNIVRGAFQSGDLGYWVAQSHNGRGIATAAVGAMISLAFDGLGLHRLQAGTLVHNIGSQTVLQRNGFQRLGLAPKYLRIDGRWQDHILFQRLNDPPILP